MNKTSKHILFLPRWYPHQGDEMYGLFVKKHAEAAAIYNKVSVLYVQGLSSKKPFKKTEQFEQENLSTHIYYYKNSSFIPYNVIRYWYYLIIGYRLIKQKYGKPDLTHVHILTRLGFFAFILEKVSKIPFIISEHWSRYLPYNGTYKGWWRKRITARVVKNSRAILPVSTILMEAMQKHGLKNPNYFIVPNVVDDLFYQSYERKKTGNPIVFLHVSTFEDKSKNISGLLRVIKNLSLVNTNFEFNFVGDGVDFESIKNYAAVLNIPKNQVHFYGIEQGERLAKRYRQADYLVMFSNYETFLIVFHEAQACGLPIVTSRVGNLDQFISKTNGFLVDPGNEKQLESVLKNILISKPLFDSTKIQNKSNMQYSAKAIGKQLDNIYTVCV